MNDDIAKAMGLPNAWEGDPKAIGRFLRFFHGQLQQIDLGVPNGEFRIRMRQVTNECERAMMFVDGYAAGAVSE